MTSIDSNSFLRCSSENIGQFSYPRKTEIGQHVTQNLLIE